MLWLWIGPTPNFPTLFHEKKKRSLYAGEHGGPYGAALIDYILFTYDSIRTKHPNAGVMLLGDFNHLDLSQICMGNNLKQVVNFQHVKVLRILDKIVTNIQRHYDTPVICSPEGCSDHSTVLWKPTAPYHQPNTIIKRAVRPLKDTSIREFGQWITGETWNGVYSATTV